MGNWKSLVDQYIDAKELSGGLNYTKSNVIAVKSIINGLAQDADKSNYDIGAHMAINIAAVHIPAFCRLSKNGDTKPYKNYYDMERTKARLGAPSPAQSKRKTVDNSLPLPEGVHPEDIYFGAVELNGSGIRFYGDICLVLKRDQIKKDTLVLDRNSYDLIRSPISDEVNKEDEDSREDKRKSYAKSISGTWGNDLEDMAVVKVLEALGNRERRYTTGQISDAIRNDEDYIEVLKLGSFGTNSLQEARISSSDAALDALTGDRLHHRPAPRLEALMSRFRRREAEKSLRKEGIFVRILTTTGRTKD